jgi:hypothetical protein
VNLFIQQFRGILRHELTTWPYNRSRAPLIEGAAKNGNFSVRTNERKLRLDPTSNYKYYLN